MCTAVGLHTHSQKVPCAGEFSKQARDTHVLINRCDYRENNLLVVQLNHYSGAEWFH